VVAPPIADIEAASKVVVMHLTHTLKNGRDQPIGFWLEPWAEQFDIPAGSTLKLLCECRDQEEGTPEVEVTEALMIYFFGSGCRVKVWVDDHEVTTASWNLQSP
jgi:hypothetical protein